MDNVRSTHHRRANYSWWAAGDDCGLVFPIEHLLLRVMILGLGNNPRWLVTGGLVTPLPSELARWSVPRLHPQGHKILEDTGLTAGCLLSLLLPVLAAPKGAGTDPATAGLRSLCGKCLGDASLSAGRFVWRETRPGSGQVVTACDDSHPNPPDNNG